jgi:hypothetical protein
MRFYNPFAPETLIKIPAMKRILATLLPALSGLLLPAPLAAQEQ